MSVSVRVLVVYDHALVRAALCDSLAHVDGLEVVGSADRVTDARPLLRRDPPDVLILDITLGDDGAMATARQVLREAPFTRVILLTARVSDQVIDLALTLGVHGYVSKREPIGRLIEAIELVSQGVVYHSPEVRQRLVPVGGHAHSLRLGSRSSTLTVRQREVLLHIAHGRPKNEVARLLGVSIKTIETHCEMLMRRLQIHDRVELTRFAIREGLVKA